jgi:hypothetical protein
MHVFRVDRQAPSECRLAGGSPFGEGAQDDEVLPAKAVSGERLGDKSC